MLSQLITLVIFDEINSKFSAQETISSEAVEQGVYCGSCFGGAGGWNHYVTQQHKSVI